MPPPDPVMESAALPLALLSELAPELRRRLETGEWTTIGVGESDAQVLRLSGERPRLYFKTAVGEAGRELDAESARLRWLTGKLPVPELLHAGRDGDRSWLVTVELPGKDMSGPCPEVRLSARAERFAEGLRLIHAVPIAGCPFDHHLDVRLAEARRSTARGLVPGDDFDADREGPSAVSVLAELIAHRPAEGPTVFCHGDYCLPNVVLERGQLSGFLDLSRAGLSDPYRDLALAERSIRRNWGPKWVDHFFRAYGLDRPDLERIAYYRLLDEFF